MHCVTRQCVCPPGIAQEVGVKCGVSRFTLSVRLQEVHSGLWLQHMKWINYAVQNWNLVQEECVCLLMPGNAIATQLCACILASSSCSKKSGQVK